ncbi:MAG: hypothetical protein M3Z17_03475 [Gemmatimonadota bacterium]|nr:hypothetical protein [Gemmatimonadota bacterium]
MMNDDKPRDPLSGDLITRRSSTREQEGDRRRKHWTDFRRAYPGFIFTLGVALLAMVLVDGWLIYRRVAYSNEIATLRGHMTGSERDKTDAIVDATQSKARIELELAKRQARLEKRFHLNVSVDSARMYLESGGATLREMAVQFGPERTATPAGDSLPEMVPRGERTVAEVGTNEITLDGGTRIFAAGSSLDKETAPVPAGALRIGRADMEAIRPNLSPGMKVYFY